uniref:Putative Flagellar basal-body rod protein FlgB n=1 Tax=mine drainage metagenome TaxID=410659 RepID=E6QM20_9ZZZZ
MLEGITYFGKALALRNAQLDVLTSNLANASTPGYKAKNLNFREAFAHALHESGNQLGNLSHYTQYERGNPVGLDGNSVSPQQTMMQITRTALNSEADESFASGAAQSMIDAINTSTVY